MGTIWRLLRYVPRPVIRFAMRAIPAGQRLRLRQRFGARIEDIPDAIVTIPDGRRFHVGPDSMYWAIWHGLDYEPEVTAICRALTRSRDVVVDAGANMGWFSTLFARLVGPAGRVVAFEPVPATFARLEEHLALNALGSNTLSIRAALADHTGTAPIRLAKPGASGTATLATVQTQQASVEVPLTTLDAELVRLELEGCEMLKIDVEGAERLVLRGAEQTLRGDRSPIIVMELNEEACVEMGYHVGDLYDELSAAGYDAFYGITSERALVRVGERKAFTALASGLSAENPLRVIQGMVVALRAGRFAARLDGLDVREASSSERSG